MPQEPSPEIPQKALNLHHGTSDLSCERMTRSPQDIYDELLVLACQNGDVAAFEELVGRWQKRLWGHALRLTGNREAGLDALQEAWMAIVRGIRKLDDPARFRPWAYRIVTRKCADSVRRRKRERPLEKAASAERGHRSCREPGGDDQVGRVRRALQELSGAHRVVLWLRYLQGIDTAGIAAILAIPEGTVKSRLHHARDQLRTVLERD